MYIDLRRSYRLMPEHLLYGTQIRAPLKQMRGKRMAQRVGRNALAYAGRLGKPLDYLKRPLAREPPAAPVEKQYILVSDRKSVV